MRFDAALSPAEIARLPKRDLSQTTCVVFDVLRATSCMITALAAGATEIHPVQTIDEALELRKEHPRAILGGERNGEKIDGFDVGNSPFEYSTASGAKIITTTTNGTIALCSCEHALRVLVGAILNIGALVEELRWDDPEEVLLVCAGTFDDFALEDAFAAGLLLAEFPNVEMTDAARAALAVAKSNGTPLDALRAACNGKALLAKGRGAEVEWCAQVSRYNIVGLMEAGIIRPLR